MDRKFLYENLIEWIRSFNFVQYDTDVMSLLDGEIISEILYDIDPGYFTEEWKSKLKLDSTSNWRLKASNLKKIVNSMTTFLKNNLNFSLENFQFPDINEICEANNTVEMSRFLQLVLLCAVNCSRKEMYIQNIMAMENSVQLVIMKAIQEVMDNEVTTEVSYGPEEKLNMSCEQLKILQHEKESLRQKCYELESKVLLLEGEKTDLELEVEKFQRNAPSGANQNLMNNTSIGPMSESIRIRNLQDKMANLQGEIFNLEHSKDELTQKVFELESENADLKVKNEELSEKVVDQRQIKDELDITRERLKTLGAMENTLEKYKKHIDNSGEVSRQNKELELENSRYLERILKLEEEVRVVGSLKSQIDMYKKEISVIQSQCSQKEKDLSKAEFELKRVVEKLKTLENDKMNLQEELQKIREENEDLHVTSYTVGSESSSEPNSEGHDGMKIVSGIPSSAEEAIDLMQIPHHLRERVVRLQKDSRQLHNLLGDLNTTNSELSGTNEFDGKSREQLIVSLEASQARILQLTAENKQLHQEHLIINAKIEDGDPTRFHNITVENQKIVNKLKSEMENTEDKYKGYLEKAKYVIYQLHQKLLYLEQTRVQELKEAPPTPTGVQDASFAIDNKDVITRADYETLKKAFFDKERQLDELQKQYERAQSLREEEEKMMVAAWYNLGVRVHREAAQERLRSTGYQSHHQQQSSIETGSEGASTLSLNSSTGGGGGGGSGGVGVTDICNTRHSSTMSGEPNSFLARQRLAHLMTSTNNSAASWVHD